MHAMKPFSSMAKIQESNSEIVTNANGDPILNPSGPYYVDPSEDPTSVMVTTVLEGNNYNVWAISMRRALIVKNKFDFVDDSIPIPKPLDPLYAAWRRCNALVCSWILHSLSPSIAEGVLYTENAIDLWQDLKDRFSPPELLRIYELQSEIYTMKQGTLSVNEFFCKLKALWGELEYYRPIPTCTCSVQCSCEAMRNVRMFREQDYVITFLNGLNDQFSMAKSHILLTDPLPSLNEAFSMVTQQERLNNYGVSDKHDALINVEDY